MLSVISIANDAISLRNYLTIVALMLQCKILYKHKTEVQNLNVLTSV